MSTQPFVILDHGKSAEKLLDDVENKVRCYETDTFEVTNVCHHTGRYLSNLSEVKPNLLQDHSLEFAGLLKGHEAHAAHSRSFAHFLPFSPLKVLVIPGAILTVWGTVLLLNILPKILAQGIVSRTIQAFQTFPIDEAFGAIAPLVAVNWAVWLWPMILLLIGLLLLIIGANVWRIFYKISMSRPLDALPLISDYYNVLVNEKIHIPMTLNSDGNAFVNLGDVTGDGNVALEIYLDGHEVERIREAYRKKGEKFGFGPNNDFNLGWLYVKPSPYTQFNSDQNLLAIRLRILIKYISYH